MLWQDTWEGKWKMAYTVITSLAQFLLPFAVVIAIYLSIFLKLRKRPKVQGAWYGIGTSKRILRKSVTYPTEPTRSEQHPATAGQPDDCRHIAHILLLLASFKRFQGN